MSILKEELFEEREYQKTIAENATSKNTLVVLPTGMGKTLISVLVGAKRLEQFPGSKILITAPTRPLNAQHKSSFEKFTNLNPEEIALVTGKIKPEDRKRIYEFAKIIAATPQTIKNDIGSGILNFENFSFFTFDEAHRCVKDYAYTFLAKNFMMHSKNPLILGLTASPGGSEEKINEICKNLFIKAVEIRTEEDKDVESYVQPIKREWIYVDFPEDFKKIKILLDEVLFENIAWLRQKQFVQTTRFTKKQLLWLQKSLSSRFSQGSKNYALLWAIIKVVEAVKLEHAIELLETQGSGFVYEYLKKFEFSKKRTDKRIINDPRIKEALKICEELKEKGIQHPKLNKTLEVVKFLLGENRNLKIMIFANYRATVEKINNLLVDNGIKSDILIGQAMKQSPGLTQEEQISVIKSFAEGEFNVLVCTNIGEEGLDIAATDYAIFYEPVPSEIRSIQRRGRVGRQKSGKVIFLITSDTRDEAYFWAALRKEKKMKGILYDIQERKSLNKKKSLIDWIKDY